MSTSQFSRSAQNKAELTAEVYTKSEHEENLSSEEVRGDNKTNVEIWETFDYGTWKVRFSSF